MDIELAKHRQDFEEIRQLNKKAFGDIPDDHVVTMDHIYAEVAKLEQQTNITASQTVQDSIDIQMNDSNVLDISAAAKTINESIDQSTPSCLIRNQHMHDETIEECSKLPKLYNLNLSAEEEEKHTSK